MQALLVLIYHRLNSDWSNYRRFHFEYLLVYSCRKNRYLLLMASLFYEKKTPPSWHLQLSVTRKHLKSRNLSQSFIWKFALLQSFLLEIVKIERRKSSDYSLLHHPDKNPQHYYMTSLLPYSSHLHESTISLLCETGEKFMFSVLA